MSQNNLGKITERLALEALLSLGGDLFPQPEWLLSARQGTKLEDSEGADVVILTADAGTLWLQIKSSFRYRKRQHEKYARNGVVVFVIPREVARGEMTDAVMILMQGMIIALLEDRRQEVLSRNEAAA